MCALYSKARDVSLFRHISRELLGNIISQQCSFYKIKIEETKFNIYGEASEGKFFAGPILLNCLIDRSPQENEETDLGSEYGRKVIFKFLKDDLKANSLDINSNTPYGADLVPEDGDIILYQESYYEINKIYSNQYISGKNPDYPNEDNPFSPGLDEYGNNFSVVVEAHSIPADKTGISRERLI